jgi:hypothetical protein
MDEQQRVADVDREVATAVGLYLLSDDELHEVAREVDASRWEIENAIERSGFAELFGLHEDGDVSETIDDLLE